jgi:hypothetical protein
MEFLTNFRRESGIFVPFIASSEYPDTHIYIRVKLSVDEPRPAIYIFPFFLSFLGQGGRMQIKDKTEDTVCVTPARPPPKYTHIQCV